MGAVKEFFWKSEKKWKKMEKRAKADALFDYNITLKMERLLKNKKEQK